MGRATDPVTIAIRDGVDARLIELDFERKSLRYYVRETERYLEWGYFSLCDRHGFLDYYGVVDKDLKVWLETNAPEVWPVTFREPHPSHLMAQAATYGGNANFAAVTAWRKARRIWRPWEYFVQPRRYNSLYWGIFANGCWQAEPDPTLTARLAREAFIAEVEPARARWTDSREAVALATLSEYSDNFYNELQLAYAIYVGRFERADEIIARAASNVGAHPSQDDIERALAREDGLTKEILVERSLVRDREHHRRLQDMYTRLIGTV